MPPIPASPQHTPGKYRWVSPVSVLFFLLLIFCFLLTSITVFNDYKHAKSLRDQQQHGLRQLDQEIVQLEEQKKHFTLDESEKERVIRERYKMVREGEHMIQLVAKEKKTP